MSKPSRYKALCLFALLVSSVAGGVALADEFTVNAPTVLQNGGNTIDGDDTLTITGLGAIATSADFEHAVDSNGAANTIVINNGDLTTEGDGAVGIYGSDSTNMWVTNNGAISTTGIDSSYGIYVKAHSDNSRIINNGTISVLSDTSGGISIEESVGSAIENNGTVAVTGMYIYGLSSNYADNSTITNAGLVIANGQYVVGIEMGDSSGSTITNSGLVHVGGDYAFGIEIWNSTDTSVTNTGTIRTTGIYADGIYGGDSTGTILTNSGSIIAEQAYALVLDDGDTVLNLSTAGYIGGGIRFAQTATVNLAVAASHSVLWDLSDGAMAGGDPALISGDAPWFYNAATKQFATYDPSVLAGAFDELGDMTVLLSEVQRAKRGGGVWGAGFGGMARHDGDGMVTLDRDVRQFGFALGYAGEADAGTRWGVMGGFLHSELAVDSRWAASYDTDGNGGFAGVNGARDFGAMTIDAGITGGRIGRDASRFVNDNTALTGGLTLGESLARSSYGSWFVAPELGVSATLGSSEGWSLTPGARLRYAGQWTEGFTETGSAANATVDALALGLFDASVQVALARHFGFGSLSTRLGYRSRQSVGDAATVTLVGETNTVGLGDVNSESAYAGLGLDVQVTPGMRLNLDVSGHYGSTTTGGQASARIAGAF